MLIGNYTSKFSENRRVAIPSKFRNELGNTLIIAKWYEGCLAIIPDSQFQDLMGKLTGNSAGLTQSVRDTDRFILGSAYELIPDEQGRVVLPEELAVFAGLAGEAVFIGLGNRVEIWNREEWVKREVFVAEHAEELVESISGSQKNK